MYITRYKNKSLFLNTLSIIILAFNIYFPAKANSDTDSSSKPFYYIIWDDLKAAGNDAVFLGNELCAYDGGDLAITAGVLGGTGLMMTLDDEARDLARRNQTATARKFFDFTNEFGNEYKVGYFCSGVYLGGLIAGSESVRTTGRLLFESVLLSGVITNVLKVVIGRSRPFLNEGNASYNWFEIEDKFNALPSGHSTAVFAVITVLAGRIDRWWGYGLYGLTAMTMASRIYLDRHWLSDVFLGGSIGMLSGLAVLEAESGRHRSNNTGFLILPNTNGVTFSYRF